MPGVAAFDDLVHMMLGDLVDAGEVAKMSPDPSSVHASGQLVPVRRKRRAVAKRGPQGPMTAQERAQRQELERKVAQVSNGVGLAAGTAGTYSAGANYRRVKAGGAGGAVTQAATRRFKLSSKGAARLGVIGAGSALGLQVGNVAGDVITARVLGRSGVDKSLNPLNLLKTKRLASVKTTLGFGGRHSVGAAPAAPAGPRSHRIGTPLKEAMSQGSAVKTPIPDFAKPTAGEFLRSTQGKATLGVAGAYGLHTSGKNKGRDEAMYGKRDEVDIAGTFSKFDEDKKRAYGWASVVTMNGEPVIDRQGDYIGLDDIEEAAYTYVRKSRVAGDMHRRTTGLDGSDAPHRAGELIESVVFTPDKCHAMGLPASFAGKWWMGVQVEDDEVWEQVKKGNRTGFSIHGKGLRKDTTLDEIRSS